MLLTSNIGLKRLIPLPQTWKLKPGKVKVAHWYGTSTPWSHILGFVSTYFIVSKSL